MPKFRKKPVVIEAVHYSVGWPPDVLDAHPWIDAAYEDGILSNHGTKADGDRTDRYIEIKTLEGVMRANQGDWLIQGVAGEIYACKPDIFDATYEPVGNQ